MEPPLHPDLGPIAFLLGRWRGRGHGEYPTAEPFDYAEETRFWQTGLPGLAYAQRAWDPSSGEALHSEMGFWRVAGAGAVEVTLAHPIGVVEVAEGRVGDGTIRLSSSHVATTSTGEQVTRLSRRLSVDGDTLEYELLMATAGVAETRHLTATLRRAEEPRVA